MKCPFCGFANDKVVDSRESKEAESIRRRRECLKCGKRFTTYERIDEIPYMVVKKDGRRRGAAGVIPQQIAQFRLERRIAARFQIRLLQFFERRHQDFRSEEHTSEL